MTDQERQDAVGACKAWGAPLSLDHKSVTLEDTSVDPPIIITKRLKRADIVIECMALGLEELVARVLDQISPKPFFAASLKHHVTVIGPPSPFEIGVGVQTPDFNVSETVFFSKWPKKAEIEGMVKTLEDNLNQMNLLCAFLDKMGLPRKAGHTLGILGIAVGDWHLMVMAGKLTGRTVAQVTDFDECDRILQIIRKFPAYVASSKKPITHPASDPEPMTVEGIFE